MNDLIKFLQDKKRRSILIAALAPTCGWVAAFCLVATVPFGPSSAIIALSVAGGFFLGKWTEFGFGDQSVKSVKEATSTFKMIGFAVALWIPLGFYTYGYFTKSIDDDDDEVASTRLPSTLKDRHGYYRLPWGSSMEFVANPPAAPPGNVDRPNTIKLLKEAALSQGWQDSQTFPTNPPELHLRKSFQRGGYVQLFRLPTSNMSYRVTISLKNTLGMPVRNPAKVEVHMIEVNKQSERTFQWEGSDFILKSKDVPVTGAFLAFAAPVDAVVHASLE